jgi:DNA polymerase III psi subunit
VRSVARSCDIARELKITPQNARRIARNHAEALGHAGKCARWFLNADQEKALRDAADARADAVSSPLSGVKADINSGTTPALGTYEGGGHERRQDEGR